ncbi:MAG: hypothetical protein CM1200mP16_17090 [Nitrospina sp.]|nr:MAG: hypothetical protein CM1200mP16_17090 [Nitrospina sp.]
MPSLETLYQRFKNKNFAMLAISNDMFGEQLKNPFEKTNKINFPVLLDQNLKVATDLAWSACPLHL